MAAIIRKTLLNVETTLIEGGKAAGTPLTLIAAGVIFKAGGKAPSPSIKFNKEFSIFSLDKSGCSRRPVWAFFDFMFSIEHTYSRSL